MPPILDNKNPSSKSVFTASALLREARRQKGLPVVEVPRLCVLDPDGDIVRRLRLAGQAHSFESWPCYHTGLDTFLLGGQTVGIVGCVVGAPFAVLVAEADRSMVIVRDCLAGDCDPTFLIFARNRGGARKGTTTHDPTFLLGV